MSVLSVAIEEERWEAVALCLLVGLLQAASSVPQDALEGLLEALEGEEDGQE